MKNMSTLLNVILSIAVLILYVWHFNDKNKQTVPTITPTNETTATANNNTNTPIPIVYVNSDSVAHKYKLFKELKDDLERKQNKAESEIATKMKALETEIADFQQKASEGKFSQTEGEAKQNELMKKQDELLKRKDKLAEQLIKDQQNTNEKLFDKVSAILKQHNEAKKYNYILEYTKGSGILLADSTLDITNEVIELLNNDYNSEKGK